MPFFYDLRGLLAGRDFRRLLRVRLCSQASDGCFQVALASLIFFSPERAATAQATAGVFALTILPYTIIGPFAGILLDRWQRRQVLLYANLIRAGLVLLVAWILVQYSVGPLLYFSVLLCLSVNRFFLTALGASLPQVLPQSQLLTANSITPTCGTLAALLGGGLGYLIRLGLPRGDRGDAYLLVVAALGYLLASVAATRMPPTLLGPAAGAEPADPVRGWSGIRDGFRQLREHPEVMLGLTVILISRAGYATAVIGSILLCRNEFHDPSEVGAGLGLLAQVFGCSAIGFAAAAVITPWGTARWGATGWIWRCLLLAAVAQLLVLPLRPGLVLVSAGLLGLAVQGIKIRVDTTLHTKIPDAARGRAFATYDLIFNLAFVLAATGCALVIPASRFPPELALIVGLGYACASGWVAHQAKSSVVAAASVSGP